MGQSLTYPSYQQCHSNGAALILHSGDCQEHGIFRTFSLFIFTTLALVHPCHTLFTQFHSQEKRIRVLLILDRKSVV